MIVTGVDLCHGNDRYRRDDYDPPSQGIPSRYMVCASEADGVAFFTCTGSKHMPDGIEVRCSCVCHRAPRDVLVATELREGQLR